MGIRVAGVRRAPGRRRSDMRHRGSGREAPMVACRSRPEGSRPRVTSSHPELKYSVAPRVRSIFAASDSTRLARRLGSVRSPAPGDGLERAEDGPGRGVEHVPVVEDRRGRAGKHQAEVLDAAAAGTGGRSDVDGLLPARLVGGAPQRPAGDRDQLEATLRELARLVGRVEAPQNRVAARGPRDAQHAQRRRTEPTVKPAPTEASSTRSPRFNRPSRTQSSSASGIVAAVVLP